MAYMRYEDDLLAERQWRSWDTYFTEHFPPSDMRLTQARWEELVPGYDASFWAHVKGALFGD